MKFRFGEINIVCTDRERTLAFYRDVLGFEVTSEEGTAVHLRGAGLRLLVLPEAEAAPDPCAYPRRATISFDLLVDDLQVARAYFRGLGVGCEGDAEGGFFLVRDPDGLPIEIVAD